MTKMVEWLSLLFEKVNTLYDFDMNEKGSLIKIKL